MVYFYFDLSSLFLVSPAKYLILILVDKFCESDIIINRTYHIFYNLLYHLKNYSKMFIIVSIHWCVTRVGFIFDLGRYCPPWQVQDESPLQCYSEGKCIYAHQTALSLGVWDSLEYHGLTTENLSVVGRLIHK